MVSTSLSIVLYTAAVPAGVKLVMARVRGRVCVGIHGVEPVVPGVDLALSLPEYGKAASVSRDNAH